MNVRWDAVVDSAERHLPIRDGATASARRIGPPLPGSPTQVHVQLFGALSILSAEQPIQLTVPATATIADILAELGERLGETFLARVLDSAGGKRRHCRLFVDGYPVEDVSLPLGARAEPAELEIILLIAPEGG